MFDVVGSPQHAGGLSNVATIIGDLLNDDKLTPGSLADVARLYPSPAAQRVGYLIDLMACETGLSIDTDPLQQHVANSRYHELSPGYGDGGRVRRWHVIINA